MTLNSKEPMTRCDARSASHLQGRSGESPPRSISPSPGAGSFFVLWRRVYRYERPYMVPDGIVRFGYVKPIGTWFPGGCAADPSERIVWGRA